MTGRQGWGGLALLTDLYELTMLQAYRAEDMVGNAVFSLYVRRLPPERNFLIACGLDDALTYLEELRFGPDDVAWLETLGLFENSFLDWLSGFRFQGEVHAMPEGTTCFADEPLLEVIAPLPQAQLVETVLMNQVHFQTLIASKTARVVTAADGRDVVDFGLRRMHGTDAALKAARAAWIAGAAGTSNVLAARRYDIPALGTMAHSYVQAHDDEYAAFRAFQRLYPGTTLLVDTYDTLEGVRQVVRLARDLGDEFRVGAVRLDSGDLAALSKDARALLDDAGLDAVRIFASGGLDEYRIAALVEADAPIDGFGVGTRMGVSSDRPSLDIAYKLTEYEGRGRLKLSPGKPVLPGRKQVFRHDDAGRDLVAGWDERPLGRPLLRAVMRDGRRLPETLEPLEAVRARAREDMGRLPKRVCSLEPADPPYHVDVSPQLVERQRRLAEEVGG